MVDGTRGSVAGASSFSMERQRQLLRVPHPDLTAGDVSLLALFGKRRNLLCFWTPFPFPSLFVPLAPYAPFFFAKMTGFWRLRDSCPRCVELYVAVRSAWVSSHAFTVLLARCSHKECKLDPLLELPLGQDQDSVLVESVSVFYSI